jgi:hypothetical protein
MMPAINTREPTMKKLFTIALLFAAMSAQAAWKYDAHKDTMTDEVATTATLESPTRVALAFPYAGGTVARLTVASGPRGRIKLGVNRGQLEGDGVMVRFDDEPAVRYPAIPAERGEFLSLFVVGDDKAAFLAKLAAAKSVKVEATFYGDGARVFEFAPAGLTVAN